MAFITLRMEVRTVLLVFGISLLHIAWFESVSGATNIDCPTLDYNCDCPASNFRVFNGPDVQDLRDRLPPGSPERLAFAAKPGESHIVRMTRSSQLGVAQEGVNLNLDCLPWLSQFPGGSIQWKFIQLDYFDNPISNFIKFLFIFLRQPANALRGHHQAASQSGLT